MIDGDDMKYLFRVLFLGGFAAGGLLFGMIWLIIKWLS